MKRAVFPGSFDPITVGHLDIVNKGLKVFDEIIIGITSDSPNILSLQERREIFEKVLSKFNKFKYVFFDTALVDIKDNAILPKFDVCVTGNPTVVDYMKKNNFKTRILSRSEGVGYSGTEIRSIPESKSV